MARLAVARLACLWLPTALGLQAMNNQSSEGRVGSVYGNIALECPSTQGPGQWSSFSANYCQDGSTRDDSGGLTPCLTEGQGGSCQSVCHTGHGANPWYEVTLSGAATIDEVKVVNAWTHCCKSRIDPFYMRLLDSADTEISSQRFSGTQDEYVWSAIGVSGVSKVKIEVDKTSYLHMAELFVYGYGVNACGGPPTPAPASAGAPSAGGGAAAVGDPHLQNVHGERFDLMKPGKHVLINIPRGVSAEKALLRVQADARQLGGQCADMYFQDLNVTGSWAEATQVGGYRYSVSQRDVWTPEWIAFGKVGLKVVHGRTDSGLSYLNVYVKHLGQAGFAVGGLLGEDDHEDVITPPEACGKSLSLIDGEEGGHNAPSVLSVAEASLA
jgi:hypothetical protein